MVAGYIDKISLEPWSAADWARFPTAAKVRIVKKASTNDGHVLDVEPGDATPYQAPGWARMRRQSGFAWPTIYCNLSTWPSVIQAFIDQHEPMPLWWIAKYDGVKNFPTLQGQTAIAKQYAGNVAPGYDLSHVADNWPGVDGADMTLDGSDAAVVWDGTVVDKNTNGTTKARELLGWGHWEATQAHRGVDALATSVTQLKNLVIADDANDVTAQQVADALQGVIVAQVVPAVVTAVQAATADLNVDVDAHAIAAQVAEELHSRLAG